MNYTNLIIYGIYLIKHNILYKYPHIIYYYTNLINHCYMAIGETRILKIVNIILQVFIGTNGTQNISGNKPNVLILAKGHKST